ncbi:LysR family transcriptional regulator [Pseudoroseomonas cervicalis]|uniref:LysR family transcriptional regulator n=1 Tax=Teichococcus cervicalis TaxID=204525 RepID=UPI00278193A8|nr:LysR family transcriptional regulator [Pseudoroseomonas cervicalis]MDQ1081752.1 DNA-binding transcriptional LysR family regulator [Pseudoroseomonas cervicalis]
MAIDLDQLRTFVAVAEALSLTRAAEVLHLSLPAVSRRLSALEEELGISLMTRTTRRVALTQMGREFLPRARRLLDELEESLLGIRETAARRRGLITLACIPTAAYYFLPATLADFARRFPGVRVRVMDLSADGVIDMVASGGVEFGIGMEGAIVPEVEFRPLRRDPFVLACRRDHPLARRSRLRWADLESERLIGVSRRSGNRLILDRALLPLGIQPNWQYEAEHLSTSLGLAEAGLGVAVVPRLALPRSPHPILVARMLEAPRVERTTGVVVRRGVTPAPATRTLLELLERRLTAG